MRRRSALVILTTLFIVSLPSASLSLMISQLVDGDSVVFDGTYYYYPNLAYFTGKTYAEKLEAVDGLNAEGYAGFGDWQIVTREGLDRLKGAFYDDPDLVTPLFTPTAGTLAPFSYSWYEAVFAEVPAGSGWHAAWGWAYMPQPPDQVSRYGGEEYVVPDSYRGNIGAWVWSNGRPAAGVPEPSTLLLFGAGLLGLVGLNGRRRK